MNIKPANRISKVEEYYFSRKLREIREMNQNGTEVINLGIGSPDLSPSEEVISALGTSAEDGSNHGYQQYTGIPELRDAFASWYGNYFGVSLDPAREILPLIGSKEGIMHISMAFLNPGDTVLVPNPGYPAYRSVAELVGANIQEYKLSGETNWKPDLTQIEKSLAEGTKLMWVNYPGMPTGQSGDKKFFKELIDFARANNLLLVNDNPYSFILNNEPLSLLSIEGSKDVALELNSLSKSHNMAGWRIGMAAGNPEFIQYIIRVKSNMDSGMFKPLQLAAVKALESGPEWYENQNKIYYERRKSIWKIFDLLGCEYDKNQIGMFVWARIPEDKASGQDYADEILYKSRVFITPGIIFGSEGSRYLRASLCQSVETIEGAFNRINQNKSELN